MNMVKVVKKVLERAFRYIRIKYRKQGIGFRVITSGDAEAFTDGSTITVNINGSLEAARETIEEKVMVSKGKAVHEFGHVIFTDFTMLKQQSDACEDGRLYPPVSEFLNRDPSLKENFEVFENDMKTTSWDALWVVLKDILNILEDGYIEEGAFRLFSGGLSDALWFTRETQWDGFPELKELLEKGVKPYGVYSALLLEYSKWGKFKYNPEDEAESRVIDGLKMVIPYVDKVLYADSPYLRAQLCLCVFIMMWPYLREQVRSIKVITEDELKQLIGDSRGNADSAAPQGKGHATITVIKSSRSGSSKARQQTAKELKLDEDEKSKESGSKSKDKKPKDGSSEGEDERSKGSGSEGEDEKPKDGSSEGEDEKSTGSGSEGEDGKSKDGDSEGEDEKPKDGGSEGEDGKPKDGGSEGEDGKDQSDGAGSQNGSDKEPKDSGTKEDGSEGEERKPQRGDKSASKPHNGQPDGTTHEKPDGSWENDSAPEDADDAFQEGDYDVDEDSVLREMSDLLARLDREVRTEEKNEEEQDKLLSKTREVLDEVPMTAPHQKYGHRLYTPKAEKFTANLAEGFEELLKEYEKTAQVMSRKLEPYLKKKRADEVAMSGYFTGNRFDATRLVAADYRYFKQAVCPNPGKRLSVMLLVDESGSMHWHDRYKTACDAAVTLYLFLRRLEIPVAVFGHTADFNNGTLLMTQYAGFENPDRLDRYRVLCMGMTNTQRQSFGIPTRCDNRDGAAISFTGELLLRRPEETKLFIGISDGAPNAVGYRDERTTIPDIQGIVKELRRRGIIMFNAAIGEDKDDIERIYSEGFLDISNLQDLPNELLKLVKRYIK